MLTNIELISLINLKYLKWIKVNCLAYFIRNVGKYPLLILYMIVVKGLDKWYSPLFNISCLHNAD